MADVLGGIAIGFGFLAIILTSVLLFSLFIAFGIASLIVSD